MPEETNTPPTSPESIEPMRVPAGYDTPPEHHSSIGTILAVLVLMLVVIFAGLYLWGGMLTQTPESPLPSVPVLNTEPETPRAEVDEEILTTVSSSDDIDMIETDLLSTQLDTLDSELSIIENELNALGIE